MSNDYVDAVAKLGNSETELNAKYTLYTLLTMSDEEKEPLRRSVPVYSVLYRRIQESGFNISAIQFNSAIDLLNRIEYSTRCKDYV
jgi:hypothetical protein